MGMCDSGDIFRAKEDDMLSDIKGIKRYTDDILILSKGSFSKKIE